MKRLISLVLITAMLVLAVSCNTGGNPSDTSGGADGTLPAVEYTIPLSDLEKYRIVFPEDAPEGIFESAQSLRSVIADKFDIKVSYTEDFYVSWNPDVTTSEYEIIIDSRVHRPEVDALMGDLTYLDCGWRLIGKKIVICGGTVEGTIAAVSAFCDALTKSDEIFYSSLRDRIIRTDYNYPHPDAQLLGHNITDFTIVWEGKSGSSAERAAHSVLDKIGRDTGKYLSVQSADDVSGQINEIRICTNDNTLPFGKADYSVTETDGKASIKLLAADPVVQLLAADALIGKLYDLKAGETLTVLSDSNFTSEVKTMTGYPVKSIKIGSRDISEYSIVCNDADADALASAKELAAYINRACGAELKIISQSQSAAYEIVVGKTDRDTADVTSRRDTLKNDGIMYFNSGNRLFIGSHSRVGTYYSVYRFLTEKIGCRFYSDNCERILASDGIVIPENLDYSYSPSLFYRYTDWQLNANMKHKLGINGYDGIENSIVWHQHTMTTLAECSATTQPCLTDEAVYQTVLKNVRKWIVENPGCRVISVTQNDNKNYCQCPNCSALAAKEGQSGVMITFANRLADEISKDYPEVKILTFAYQYTRKPPATVVPNDNVIVWLCSIECCFSDALTDASCDKNTAFVADIEAWSKIAKNLYIWDYSTDYRYYNLPFPDLFTLFDNTSFYVDHNAIGLYEEGCYAQVENGEFSRLRAYLTAQLLWNPAMSREEYEALMNDFLEGYYGAGWKYIRHFIDLTVEAVSSTHMTIFMQPATTYLSKASKDFAYWLECFKLAEGAALTDDTRNHCRYSSIQARLLTGNYDPNGHEILDLMHEAGVIYCSEANGNTPIAGMTKDSQIINYQ